jgi:threonine/homoserine/homoserine lactone efflux protein
MGLAFWITSLVVVATPGTGALITVSAGLRRGRRASVVAAFGCTLGIVPHLAAAVTGTAALLRASGVAFEAVKLLGVAYLLVMAIVTWRDRSPLVVASDGGAETTGDGRDGRDGRDGSTARAIGSAVAANLLNPKLTIFFFAFLPQFVPRGAPHQLATMLLLSAIFMVLTFVVFVAYGVFAASARRHLVGRPRVVRRFRQAFAASFVALGAKLATTAR